MLPSPYPHCHLLSFGVRPVALEVSVSRLIYMIGPINYPFSHEYAPSTSLSKIFTSVSQSSPTENITKHGYSTAAFDNELQCLERKGKPLKIQPLGLIETLARPSAAGRLGTKAAFTHSVIVTECLLCPQCHQTAPRWEDPDMASLGMSLWEPCGDTWGNKVTADSP